VEKGAPFTSEPEILARDSADPVPVTEAEEISADEVALQETGRDLRPDTITPSPDITSSGVETPENLEEIAAEVLAADSDSDAIAEDSETSVSADSEEEAASSGNLDEEKH